MWLHMATPNWRCLLAFLGMRTPSSLSLSFVSPPLQHCSSSLHIALRKTKLSFSLSDPGEMGKTTAAAAAAAAAEDELELEAMRKEDSSWHPCQVSLSSESSTSFSLTVEFGSQDDSDESIFTEDEALTRLRFRSSPLQGDDCLHVKEGDHVLAYQKTQCRGLFLDAEVEKVCRTRHSKKTLCRCTFGIRWSHPDLEGGIMTVPSSSIMKMARNKIQNHPTVSAFLNSTKTLNCSYVSSFSSLHEDTTCEADLTILLERQIEEISKLADTSIKGCSEDVLFEFTRGQARERTAVASQMSFLRDQGPHDKNFSKRSTRSQTKIEVETTSKDPPSQPNLEESNRTHLSPLRARAFLASLMHELTAEPELSSFCGEREDIANEFQKTSNAESLDASYTSMDIDASIQGKVTVSMTNDISSEEDAHTTSDRKDASNKSLQTKGSLEMLIMQEKPTLKFDEPEEKSSNKKTLTYSAIDKKLNHPVKAVRLTRSAMQRGARNLNDEVELHSPIDDAKVVGTPTPMTRLTRSAIQKEERPTVEFKQGFDESKPIECSDSTKRDHVPLTKETRNKKSVTSPVDSTMTRLTRSAIQKEERLTVEFKHRLEESKSVQWSDSSNGDHDPSLTKKRNSVTSVVATEMSLPLAQERSKKQRVSSVPSVSSSKGKTSGNGEGRQGAKMTCIASNKKPELRFSPRLRFLPRTRSQKSSSRA